MWSMLAFEIAANARTKGAKDKKKRKSKGTGTEVDPLLGDYKAKNRQLVKEHSHKYKESYQIYKETQKKYRRKPDSFRSYVARKIGDAKVKAMGRQSKKAFEAWRKDPYSSAMGDI